jgi:hypothetical protein
MEAFVKQLTGPRGSETIHHPNPSPSRPAAELPLVTRFRDPDQPYEDLIMCERDCMRCSYAFTLDCDGNCGSCPRQSYCPCVNPAKIRNKGVRPGETAAEVELPMVTALGSN